MSSEDDSSFSIDEIRKQLQALGYDHVNDERLYQFQSDLSRLMTTSNNSGHTTPKDVGAGDADHVTKPTMPRFDAFDPYSETVNYLIIGHFLFLRRFYSTEWLKRSDQALKSEIWLACLHYERQSVPFSDWSAEILANQKKEERLPQIGGMPADFTFVSFESFFGPF